MMPASPQLKITRLPPHSPPIVSFEEEKASHVNLNDAIFQGASLLCTPNPLAYNQLLLLLDEIILSTQEQDIEHLPASYNGLKCEIDDHTATFIAKNYPLSVFIPLDKPLDIPHLKHQRLTYSFLYRYQSWVSITIRLD